MIMIVTKAVFLSLLILSVVTDSAPADERIISDQDRLKYESDDIHMRPRICRFGTEQEVHDTKGAVSIKCHEKNEHMVHYHNGIPMFPFLKAGTAGGIDLTCPDKPPVILQDCRRWIYDKCPFTCAFGFTYADHRNTTMACELRGPLNNVTAEWSLQEPCVPVSGGKSDVAEISGNTGTSKHPEDEILNPTQPIPDEASDASPDPKTSATGDEDTDNSIVITVIIVIAVIILATIIATPVIVKWQRKKAKNNENEKAKLESDESLSSTPVTSTGASAESVTELTPFVLPQSPVQNQQMHLNPSKTYEQPSEPPETDSYASGIDAANRTATEPFTGGVKNSSWWTLKSVSSNGGESLFKLSNKAMAELQQCPEHVPLTSTVDYYQQKNKNQHMQDKDDDPLKALYDEEALLTPVPGSLENIKVHGKTIEFISGKGKENMGLCSAPDGASSSVSSYPPVPVVSCTANVQMLRNSRRKQYHELRLALEKKSWKKDNQEQPTLRGYVMENWKRLGFVNVDDVLSQENKWKNHDPEHLKAEDRFMHHLQAYGDTVGMLVEYFSRPVSRNAQAVAIMLDMHVGCPYCEQFRQIQEKASPVV